MNLKDENLSSQLIAFLQKAPPIHIEIYPLEVYFVCQALMNYLLFKPGHKTMDVLAKKLCRSLERRFPNLATLITVNLMKGVQDFYESVRN